MADLSVNIAGVEWKNPVTTGSGTFGFGEEYAEYFDLSELGAVCLKALSAVPRQGNPSPRIAYGNFKQRGFAESGGRVFYRQLSAEA